MKKISILIFIMLGFILPSKAQNCANYKQELEGVPPFKKSSLSKSGPIEEGGQYNFRAALTSGRYYRISFFASGLEDEMEFKLVLKYANGRTDTIATMPGTPSEENQIPIEDEAAEEPQQTDEYSDDYSDDYYSDDYSDDYGDDYSDETTEEQPEESNEPKYYAKFGTALLVPWKDEKNGKVVYPFIDFNVTTPVTLEIIIKVDNPSVPNTKKRACLAIIILEKELSGSGF